jgi:hypothetical protein
MPTIVDKLIEYLDLVSKQIILQFKDFQKMKTGQGSGMTKTHKDILAELLPKDIVKMIQTF